MKLRNLVKMAAVISFALFGVLILIHKIGFLILSAKLTVMLLKAAFVISGSFVCIPLLKEFYSVTLEPDMLTGLSSPMPLTSFRKSCGYERIAHVEYHSFYGMLFYQLCDKRKRTLLFIPCDLADFNKFKASVLARLGKNHPFSETLLMEDRGSGPEDGVNPESVKDAYLVTGKVVLPDGSSPPVVVKLEINQRGRVIDTAMSTSNGSFSFKVSSYPGVHSVNIVSSFYRGGATFSLPRNYKEDIRITAKPASSRRSA